MGTVATVITPEARASESMHWYGRDGSSAYEVIGAKGQNRPTTLRDARKLGLVPSVTTIIKCAAAPGLEVWKQQQMMMSALTLPRRSDETEADWLARVVHDSKEAGRKAAERGTTIHTSIQGFYEGEGAADHLPHVQGTESAVMAHFGCQAWVAEQSFAHPMGFGGKVDLHCPLAVVDFKTKEFGPDSDLKTWPEHHMQLAAYRMGLAIPTARCAIAYVSVSHPGVCRVMELSEKSLDAGWRCFAALLAYWKARNDFECGWTDEFVATV